MATKKKPAKESTPAAPEVVSPAAAKPAAKKAAPAKPVAAATASKVAKAPAEKAEKPASAKAATPKPAAAKSPAAKPAASKAAAAEPAAKPAAAPKKAAAAKPAVTGAGKAPAKAAAPPPSKPGAPKAGASKAVPAKPTLTKAPSHARSMGGGGGLDDMDDPDDDDLDDDEDARPAAPVAEESEEDPVQTVAAEPEMAEPVPRPVKRLTPRPIPAMPPRKAGVVTVALSPDADDAFMLYALAHGKIDTEGRTYEFVRGDIAALNEEAKTGTYDVTAFSFGAWPQVVERYVALSCGSSFGDGVGPMVVSKTLVRPNEVDGMLVGVPGLTTTAALVLRLWLSPARLKLVNVPFQEVVAAVKSGKVRAGVLIHEAQLTYRLDGLAKVMDLGRWWTDKTEGLPLPLGGTAIRRDIPAEERTKVALDLKRSIAYGMGHREEALGYAAQFSKGLPRQLLDKYIAMYVNELTLDIGERGRQAVHTLFDYAVRQGTMKERIDLEMS